MSYVGPIQCPDCQSPISDEASFCPYCHSSAPMSAPWKEGQWLTAGILGGAMLLIFFVDKLFGTKLLTTLWSWLSSGN